MRLVLLIAGLFHWIYGIAQQPLPPIGLWREHLPYNSAIDVTWGNGKIYSATPYSLFTINSRDNTIERMSRVTGLSETGISTIFYDVPNDKLLIAYNNSNIDIIYRNDIINVPDIKRDNIIGDKNIYSIYSAGKNYYLSTGIGVVVIDGDKYEIKDSWFIGNNGNHVKINGFTSDANFFYAATEEGLKKTAVNTANPADHANWQLVSGANGLSIGSAQNVVTIQNKVVVQHNDSLFVQNGTTWTLLYENGWPIVNTTISENKITLSQRRLTGESKVTILNPDGTVSRTLTQAGVISFPRKTILVQNDPWVADQFGGLSHFTASSSEQFKPNSPEATASGDMIVSNNIFYATAGEVNDAWNYQYNGNGIYVFKEGQWNNINRYRFPKLDTLLDYITIAIDPGDQTVWAGSFGGGLLHIKTDQSFDIIKQGVIGPAIGDPSSYRISGLAFDHDNNLWVSNYAASQPLLVKKKDGNWLKFSLPFFLTENSLTQILVDDNDFKWIVTAKGGGLICLNSGASLESTGDDRWKMYNSGTGNGNLPDGGVLCVVKDKNGFIWVGTTNGIAVIQCPQDAFSGQGCEAIWPIVQQGNFAGYLFNGEEVRSIAVDGADRKWVATKNGLWLVDATGEKVIYQFTEENSPLLSNDVKKVTIDGKTGEVYVATLKGICSFRSTATEGEETTKDLLVFPNPVPPNYSGTIAIRGVANNAIVKITELNGRLVYQTKALG
ncbi:MAG: two-component regulator propeller domain-containing protein, partial [Chitinophagaceae bacterium]